MEIGSCVLIQGLPRVGLMVSCSFSNFRMFFYVLMKAKAGGEHSRVHGWRPPRKEMAVTYW